MICLEEFSTSNFIFFERNSLLLEDLRARRLDFEVKCLLEKDFHWFKVLFVFKCGLFENHLVQIFLLPSYYVLRYFSEAQQFAKV